MALPSAGPTASPTYASGAANSRTLDSSPPMPPSQRRPGSVLFTPPADDSAGMGAMGADPLVQTMVATKQVDQAFQKLATLYPELVDPLAQLQQSFRQLITGLLSAQATGGMGGPGGGQGAPPIVPPLPMQGGQTPGLQQAPGV